MSSQVRTVDRQSLIRVYVRKPDVDVVHFTIGAPYNRTFANCSKLLTFFGFLACTIKSRGLTPARLTFNRKFCFVILAARGLGAIRAV